MDSLTRIRAVKTYVTDVGLEHLAGIKKLELLDLRECNQLSDNGIAHLRGLTQLKELELQGPGITSIGLRNLTALQKPSRTQLA
ncbi:hypothetical protein [Novipirellula artificiosorum]|uniref:hypothetical protein n=1 Tax=Novipirellula artificiosorum TaxID=2528016 RepID=UPI0011B4F03E|nr:hypothetical protein [Novipirellula artificiosorum]